MRQSFGEHSVIVSEENGHFSPDLLPSSLYINMKKGPLGVDSVTH